MDTMIDKPYVNAVPIAVGGFGKDHLFEFYRDIFIPAVPKDFDMELISRTVDEKRLSLVDEMIVKFTHSIEIGWLLPKYLQQTNMLKYQWL